MPGIELDGAHVFYRRNGLGEPVVLVHGTGCSGAQWDRTSEALSGSHDVIRPDLYGHGGSQSWPGRRAITLADEARLVVAVMRHIDGPVHLVGHSYGGAVALRVAPSLPHRIETLTLVEPAAFFLLRGRGGPDDGLAAEIEEVALSVVAAVVTGDHDHGMEQFVDYWSGSGAWSALPEERRNGLAAKIHAVALNFSAISAETSTIDSFRGLQCPVLLVKGDRSPAPTRRIVEMLAKALPWSRMRTIPGAGHMLPLTHREAFDAALREHIGNWPIAHRAAA